MVEKRKKLWNDHLGVPVKLTITDMDRVGSGQGLLFRSTLHQSSGPPNRLKLVRTLPLFRARFVRRVMLISFLCLCQSRFLAEDCGGRKVVLQAVVTYSGDRMSDGSKENSGPQASCRKKKQDVDEGFVKDLINHIDEFVHASYDEHKTCLAKTVKKLFGMNKAVQNTTGAPPPPTISVLPLRVNTSD